MPTVLLPADILSLGQILMAGGVKQFYSALETKGYCYPGWALGMASSMGVPAIPSADYVNGTALMGIGSPIFRILGGPAVDKLRFDIAKSYLRALNRLAHGAAGVDRDITADEALRVLGEGLERNGLGMENWNLYLPLSILDRLAGDEAVERFWTFLRDSLRHPPAVGILAKLAIIAFLHKQTMSGDIKCRQMAAAWFSRNTSVYTCEEVDQKLDSALQAIGHGLQPELVAFLELLDLEAHGLAADREPGRRSNQNCRGPLRAPAEGGSEVDPQTTAVYRALLGRLVP